jgi:16S rRNA (guanine966-N2)-methyltransferase
VTRIVAGAARGRKLSVPPGSSTRPTADRVREALFSTLDAQLGGFDGVRVLDLYAGSGALGLEALSRGGSHALLVESDARAARVIRANVADLGFGASAQVVTAAVERVLATPPETPYHLVLADPPYAMSAAELTGVLEALTRGWLEPGAVVVVERDRRGEAVTWPAGLVGDRERRYGETVLWYGHSPETTLTHG